MFWLQLCLFVSTALQVSYLNFSTITNSKNSVIPLTVGTGTNVPYSVQFWMRPLNNPTDTGTYSALQVANDWTAQYSMPASYLTVQGSGDYCLMNSITLGAWNHISITYTSGTTQIFSCYVNGTLADSRGLVQTAAKSPNTINIGGTFAGNLYDLRVYVGSALSLYDIKRNFTSYFVSPYPAGLTIYYRLSLETSSSSIIKNYIANTNVIFSTTTFKNIWLTEATGSLILCPAGSFNLNGVCTSCASTCTFCAGTVMNQCYNTTRKFLDFSSSTLTDTIKSKFFTSISTIELWFYPLTWSSNTEIFSVANLISIKQRGKDPIVSFYDGLGNEVFNFTAPLDTWQHISWVLQPSTKKALIYVNSTSYSVMWSNNTADAMFYLGSNSTNRFLGKIADVRMWTTQRIPTNITANLYVVNSTTAVDLLTYCPLNDARPSINCKSLTTTFSSLTNNWKSQDCTSENCMFWCPFKFYYSTTNGECSACDSSCSSCNGSLATDCTSCSDTDFQIAGINSCYKSCPSGYKIQGLNCLPCTDGYFLSGVQCIQCPTGCPSCTNATFCTSCSLGYGPYTELDRTICVQQCPVGSYLNHTTMSCSTCNASCTTCFNSSTDCTSCPNSQVVFNGSCYSECPPFTYKNGTNCFSCDKSCLTCTGPNGTECGTCKPSYIYTDNIGNCYESCPRYLVPQNKKCVDTCPIQYYLLANNSCANCDPSCLNCSGPLATNCLSCLNYIYQNTCVSKCPNNTYVNNSACYNCDITCATCDVNSTNCLTCANGTSYMYGASCYATCPGSSLLVQGTTTCVDECAKGYYLVNSTCVPCSENCFLCEKSSSTCTACPSNKYLYNSTCVFPCPDGFFGDSTTCQPCDNTCATCSATTFCQSCTNLTLFVDQSIGTCNKTCNVSTYTQEKACVKSCSNGYYPQEINKTCLSCPLGCTQCTSESLCQSCNSSYYFNSGTCLASCPATGFYPNNTGMYCGTCDPACIQCNSNSANNCTVCAGSNIVYVNPSGVSTCVTSCPAGTFQNSTICSSCMSNCQLCSNGVTCNVCKSGFYLRSDKICSSSCAYGDLVNSNAFSCVGYTSLFPVGNISLAAFAVINITYPIAVNKGAGNITVYSVSNSTYTAVISYYINQDSTSSLLNSMTTSVLSTTFNYDTNYTIEYSANSVSTSAGSNYNIPKGIWNFYIQPYASSPLIVKINEGIRGIELQKGSSFLLDASKSYDPSAGYKTSVLSGLWGCMNFTTSFAQSSRSSISWSDYVNSVSPTDPTQSLCSFWNYTYPPTTSTFQIPSLNELYVVLRFVYTLSDLSGRSTTKDLYIRTVPKTETPVSLGSLPVFRVNTDKDLQLMVNDPVFKSGSQYLWGYISSSKQPKFSTGLTSWVLSVSAYSMDPNAIYTFSVTYSDMNSKSSAIVVIETNSPPISGSITIDKMSATTIIDNLTVKMIGWIDDDLPLSYSFVLAQNVTNVNYLISGVQNAPTLTTAYPSGNIKIIGYCYDSLGSRSNASISNITVNALNDLSNYIIQFDTLPTVIDETNAFTFLPTLIALAYELNRSNYINDISIEKKSGIISLLNQAKTVADGIYSRDSTDIRYAYMYSGIIGALDVVIKDPLDEKSVSGVMNILNSIDFSRLETKQKIFPIRNVTISAMSPQYLLRTEETRNLATTLADIIEKASLSIYGKQYTSDIYTLLTNMNLILSSGSIITQTPMNLTLPSISMVTSKSLLTKIENTNITISTGHIVSVPSNLSSSINASQISIVTALVNTNPFSDNTTMLNRYLVVEIQDLQDNETLIVKDLEDPFMLTFNISKDDLVSMMNEVNSKQGGNARVWPECTYWDEAASTWDSEGCSLSNIGQIYGYFEYIGIPNSFQLICSCNHLSQFSIKFSAASEILLSSFILRDHNEAEFSTKKWESSIVLYLMISGVITLFITMSLAYYWDNYNPGLGIPSVETEKTFRYWDPNKIEAVLAQLEKEFIKQLTESGSGEKKDTTSAISKILNSGLVSKLMLENSKELKENYEENKRPGKPHPIEELMQVDSDDENIAARTKKYLKRGLQDPRFVPTLVSEPKPRQNSNRKDLESTVAQLKLHLNHLETNTEVPTPVDHFLDRYDDSSKLPQALKSKLKLDKRDLSKSDLKSLGVNPGEFTALRPNKSGKIVADTSMLTGGKYSEKIVEEVRRFYGNLKMSYWSLFLMYIKKEHKYVSLLFNLHIEYSKKQMLALVSVFWYLQLLACQVYITYLNWEWQKSYNQSGLCVWGCNYESQLLAGVVCAIIPWPFYYICKYLFARNMIEYSAPYASKVQAHQNKHCREMVGTIFSFSLILVSIIGIIVISAKDPFDKPTADEFIYCYLASMIWSVFIGEFIATVFKAWLVWMASSKNFKNNQNLMPSIWARFAKSMLTHFPCLLPTEL